MWANKGAAAHTIALVGLSVDAGAITTGHTFTRAFTKVGTYRSVCTVPLFMLGRIIVRG